MASDRLLLNDVVGGFAPGQTRRATLLLTYTFDGKWIEESLVPDLFDQAVATALVIRDGNAIRSESSSVRYHRADASFTRRVFHSKLVLLVAEDRALAFVGSANLTRGGLETNLELGSVFEISPAGGPTQLFRALLDYLSTGLAQEVVGMPAAALQDTCVALRDILRALPKEKSPQHFFLHNYETPLWEQILAALPHRRVAQISIVSPFFQPNSQDRDDPEPIHGDDGIFERLFRDLTFDPPKNTKAVTVFFREAEGNTQLPIDTLKRWKEHIGLRQWVHTADDARPLHGKLLLIEGAKAGAHEPYAVVVHGSPNFTSAALLTRPSEGNAEIAVLTRLPAKRGPTERVWSALDLERFSAEVKDWSVLKYGAPPARPLSRPERFRVVDAWLRVADHRLKIEWRGTVPTGSELVVLIEVDGAWRPVGTGTADARHTLEIDAAPLIATDEDGLVSLMAARIKVEVRGAEHQTVAESIAPINADCAEQFCGLSMISQLLATLDQRIASAGCGTIPTYRDQMKFLEQHRSKTKRKARALNVLTHNADLDRFFRNLQAGFRGLRARLMAMPSSEFTLQKALKDLNGWCREALSPEGRIPTDECRLYLIDRLARELTWALDHAGDKAELSQKVPGIAKELALRQTVAAVRAWVGATATEKVEGYADETCRRLQSLVSRLTRGGVA